MCGVSGPSDDTGATPKMIKSHRLRYLGETAERQVVTHPGHVTHLNYDAAFFDVFLTASAWP